MNKIGRLYAMDYMDPNFRSCERSDILIHNEIKKLIAWMLVPEGSEEMIDGIF